MKTYRGNKFHTISVYGRLSDLFQMKCFVTPKQWIDIQQCPNTKPMKGGHTHNHKRNALLRTKFRSKDERFRAKY